MLNRSIHRNRKYPFIPMLLLVMLALGGAAGCTIKPEHQLPLNPGETYSGVYTTVDVTMEYQYTYTPGEQAGGETIDFKGDIRANRSLSELAVRLRFLDAAGKIIHTEVLYHAMKHGKGGRNISHQFPVPAGTAALAVTSTSEVRIYNDRRQQ